jgi:hypothetical protein
MASAIMPIGVAIGIAMTISAMTISVAIATGMGIGGPAAHGVSMAATVNNTRRRTVNPASGESMIERGSAGAKCMSMNSESM